MLAENSLRQSRRRFLPQTHLINETIKAIYDHGAEKAKRQKAAQNLNIYKFTCRNQTIP